MQQPSPRLLPKVALSASMGLAAYWSYLFFSQTRHVFAPKLDVSRLEHKPSPREFTEVSLTVEPGVVLEGWVRIPESMATRQGKLPCAIYFGGRSEDVRWLLQEAQGFGDLPMVFFNFRGYGRSTGKPNERVLQEDARKIFDWVCKLNWVNPSRISLIGRSLGTGVALPLACIRPVHKTVLFTPYDSLLQIARKKVPLAPVSLLLRSRFQSEKLAHLLDCPTFILLAENDTVVPHASTARLLNRFAAKPLVATVRGTDHVSVPHDPSAQSLVSRFLLQSV